MTDEEFRAYQIKQEIEDRYNIKRDAFIKRNYSERNRKEDEMEALADTKTTKKQKEIERYRKEQQSDATKTKEFFIGFYGDDQVNDLEVGLGINNKTSRSFEEIYDEVDKVLLNAPISFQKVVNEGATNNSTFKPQFAHLPINPNDLLWGSLKPLLTPVIPGKIPQISRFSNSFFP